VSEGLASSDTKRVKTAEQTIFQFDGNVAAVKYNEVKMYVVRSSEVKVIRGTWGSYLKNVTSYEVCSW